MTSATNRRKALVRILANSSITGLSRAASESSVVLKVFWSVLFIAGMVGFSVNFNNISKRLMQEPILTQTNREYADFVWPHITFCNPSNPIAFWKDRRLKEKWKSFKANAVKLLPLLKNNSTPKTKEELILSSISPVEFFDSGIEVNIYYVRVRYHYSKKIAGSSENYDAYHELPKFHLAVDDHLTSLNFPMPCYTLKPESLFGNDSSTKISDVYGMKLLFIMDYASYRFFNRGYQNRKLYLYLKRPNRTQTSSNLFFIAPGTTSHFLVSEERLTRLKHCHKNDFQVELYDSKYNETRHYSGDYDDCRYRLSQRIYHENCGCYNTLLPIFKLHDTLPKLCLNMSIYNSTEIVENLNCIKRISQHYGKEKAFETILDEECGQYAKPSCNQSYYSFVRRTNIWPRRVNPERRERLIKNARLLPNAPRDGKTNVTENFIYHNCASVDLHRGNDKSVLTFEELEYPLAAYLSDVGGLLGLWLGLSAISVFEFIELLIMFSVHIFKGSRVP